MADPLIETVTVERPVDPRIADLVHFARESIRRAQGRYSVPDNELITWAREYWDREHGED